jgi:hypothetical protein
VQRRRALRELGELARAELAGRSGLEGAHLLVDELADASSLALESLRDELP